MRLNDMLQICLLSLASRYPVHTVDFNDEVLAIPGIKTRGWTAQEMIELLNAYSSQLLQSPAFLLVDECHCEIFLPMYSMDRPAMYIHCREKNPASSGQCIKKREGKYDLTLTA